MEALRINDRIVLAPSELSWTAVRASGPGGQNVNKVASKVELCFDLARCPSLSYSVKARLWTACANRLDAQGRVRIVSQATRDQAKNLEDARDKLAALVRAALVVPKIRRATKPTRGSQRRRVEDKRRTSQKKQLRSRIGGDD
ncbi:MAG TPA: alternative ribosome rescue aminoacyl-tRNA hydrolase ArfB [Polyangiales bacterium]